MRQFLQRDGKSCYLHCAGISRQLHGDCQERSGPHKKCAGDGKCYGAGDHLRGSCNSRVEKQYDSDLHGNGRTHNKHGCKVERKLRLAVEHDG